MHIQAICTNYHLATGLRLVGIQTTLVHTPTALKEEYQKALQNKALGILLIEEHLAPKTTQPTTLPIIVTLPHIKDP